MQSRTSYARSRPTGSPGAIRTLGILAIPLLLLAAAAGVVALRPTSGTAHAATLTGLRVQGNQLQDGSGKPVRLLGVNRSGTEYACVQGWGVFDGPSDAASVQAMAAWHVNSVRVPLNEDCWLGINGVPAADAGATYQRAIVSYVNLLHQYGMYAELSLIWGAPGSNQATYQPGAPDEDHSPAFWSSLASTFKTDSNVVLAPWGETIVDWSCFRNGGVCEATYGSNNTPYDTAGMQQAVNVMRGAGYTGVIAIPCIDYANDCTDSNGNWLRYEPSDPLHQLVAEAHVYGKNTCDTTACLDNTMAPIASQVPMVFGETGETYDGSDCNNSTSYISSFMTWADAHSVSYEAWTWDTWGSCNLSLITNYNGTPYGAYGKYVEQHLQAESGGGGGSPTPTATTPPSPSPSPSPGACASPAISFGAQGASPSQVAAGQPITFTTGFTSSCATTGLVDFEVFTAGGKRVWQTWRDNQQLTGKSQTFKATWNVSASQAPGRYYVSIGVFSPGWTQLWAWKHQAASFSVTSASPACTSTSGPTIDFIGASGTPNPVARGATARLSVTFVASCAITGLVDYAVYDGSGRLVYQTWLDNRWLSGQPQTFAVSWNVPSGQAPGTYHLSLGVFSPGSTGWSTLYGWDQAAAPLTVR